ncbi:MAG TPA: Ig domain-containing protein, partial [Blastocatellia bacterium]
PNGTVGADYSQTLTAMGGTAPFTFTVSSGALPPGLTLSSAGAISGTPTAAGSFSFTVQALDSKGCTGEITYSLKVATRKSKSVSSACDKPRAATNSAPIARASAGRSWRETGRKRSKR